MNPIQDESEVGPEDALAFANFLQKSEHPFSPHLSYKAYEDLFSRTFIRCNDELNLKQFDTSLSGSTVVMVFIEGTRLICANLGDSRAVKCQIVVNQGTDGDEDSIELVANELSNDHKLEVEEECERILACGGRVESFKDT